LWYISAIMLKRLAILGLLLTITQAPVPVPGQTANNPAGGGGNVQKQPEGGKPNAQTPVSAMPESSAGPAKPDAHKPSAKDASNSITIRELPTVSVGKDWADWSYWGFGGLLVIVGGSQVLFLYRTLKAIQTQAGHMERQTKALEDSVAAAQKSADAALAQVEAAKSTQRAQLRIELGEPELTFNEELSGYPVRFQVTLDGTTRAYVLQSSILAYMGRTAREQKSPSINMGVPRNFTPEMSPFDDYTLIRKNSGWPDVDTDPGKADLVHKHNVTVYVDGDILYRDIFGDEWILEIDRVWVPNSRHAGEGATGGMWVPFSSGRYDRHHKIERQKQKQRPKPK
jgi:hypothetical protein